MYEAENTLGLLQIARAGEIDIGIAVDCDDLLYDSTHARVFLEVSHEIEDHFICHSQSQLLHSHASLLALSFIRILRSLLWSKCRHVALGFLRPDQLFDFKLLLFCVGLELLGFLKTLSHGLHP